MSQPFRAFWAGRPAGRLLALAAAAGAVMALGQAPLGWWFATLPALALVIRLAVAQGGPWVMAAAGFGYFALALSWIVEPFLIDAATYGWMAPFALVFLAAGMALFWAGAGWAARFGGLALALALVLAELLRGYVLTGFPWALVGHVWIGWAPAQLAAVAGPSGLTLFTCLIAAGLAAWRVWPAVASAAMLAAGFGFGLWQLAQPMPAGTGVFLRLVQPAAPQAMKWDPDNAATFFQRQLDYTAAGSRPDLIIWPETSVPYLIEEYPEVARAIATAGRGAPVAVGLQRSEGAPFWNSLAVIGPDGRAGQVYDKFHLVPFGEYIPFGDLVYDWFGLRAFAARQGNGYSAGAGPAVLDLGGKLGKVLPLICYEAVFPQDVRAAPERADWLLQITNDAWFGTLSGPFQHAAQARLRAIEQGLPLVRVANTGVTAVFDARGRVVADLPFGQAGYLDAELPGALAITPYARWGEIPVSGALFLLNLLGIFVARRKSA